MLQRRRYLLFTRNSASNSITRSLFLSMVDDDGISVKIDTSELDSLNNAADGEYQYAIVPYYGEWSSEEGKAYADAITYEYAGNLLDTIIHCPDGDIMLRYLHPQTGILKIGTDMVPEVITDSDAGDGHYKNYLYDEDN